MRTLLAAGSVLVSVTISACNGDGPSPMPTPTATIAAAVALVYEAQESWIGNDEFETDKDGRYNGVLNLFREALDRNPPAAQLPAASLGVVVAYSDTATLQVPMGSLARITGAALGHQVDYRGKLGNDVIVGVERALDELEHADARRRLLVIVGADIEPTVDQRVIDRLAHRLARSHIEVHALVWGLPNESMARPRLADLAQRWRNVASIDALGEGLAAAWRGE